MERIVKAVGFLTAVFVMSAVFSACVFGGWEVDGNAICTSPQSQLNGEIVSDGAGGAIIAWQDKRGGTYYDIYAQRVDSSGTVMWPTNGVAVCAAANDQMYPQIVSDGAGGAIITWQDKRGGTYYDIYAQRVDANGVVKWTADGVAICTAVDDQHSPRMIQCEAGGAIIAWADRRSGSDVVYARRVIGGGTPIWGADGVAVCTSAGTQYAPQIATDGTAGAFVAWEGWPASGHAIYAQHLSISGTLLWGGSGARVTTSEQWGVSKPDVVSDDSGGAIFTWQDWYMMGGGPEPPFYYFYYLLSQHLDENGSRLWADPVNVWSWMTMGNPLDITSDLVSDGAGGGIVGAVGNDWGIDMQRIDTSGNLLWSSVIISYNYSNDFRLVSDGAGGAIAAWSGGPGANCNIYAQRLNASGNFLWTTNGVTVCSAADYQGNPVLTSDGAGGVSIGWCDYRGGATSDIYAQRLTALGSVPSQPETAYPAPLLSPVGALGLVLAMVAVGVATMKRRSPANRN